MNESHTQPTHSDVIRETTWKLRVCPLCGDAKLKGPKHFPKAPGICQKNGHFAGREIIKVRAVER